MLNYTEEEHIMQCNDLIFHTSVSKYETYHKSQISILQTFAVAFLESHLSLTPAIHPFFILAGLGGGLVILSYLIFKIISYLGGGLADSRKEARWLDRPRTGWAATISRYFSST